MLTKVHAWRVFPGNPKFAAKGKQTYMVRIPGIGEFTINPVCGPNGKHVGYVAYCCNVFNCLPGSSLWWHLTKVDGTYSFNQRTIFSLSEARQACENFRQKFAIPDRLAA